MLNLHEKLARILLNYAKIKVDFSTLNVLSAKKLFDIRDQCIRIYRIKNILSKLVRCADSLFLPFKSLIKEKEKINK
jgi:hypothetical protein